MFIHDSKHAQLLITDLIAEIIHRSAYRKYHLSLLHDSEHIAGTSVYIARVIDGVRSHAARFTISSAADYTTVTICHSLKTGGELLII